MTDPLANFPDFARAVRQRLEQGRAAYADRSFERPVGELVGEIREELLDVAAWSYIALQRLERAEKHTVATDPMFLGARPTVAEREPSRPYVTALHGIPLTAEQHAEVQRLARAEGAITASMVWRVKTASEERAAKGA